MRSRRQRGRGERGRTIFGLVRWPRTTGLIACALAWVLTGLWSGAALAQNPTLPVRATVTVASASVYPEDLARPGALVVSLTLRDLTSGPREVRLALGIEDGAGRTLGIAAGGQPLDPVAAARLPVVTLLPGVPTVLTGEALRPAIDEVVAGGITGGFGAGLAGGGAGGGPLLREGPITVCAAAYDAPRGDLPSLSGETCGVAFAELADPPTGLTPGGDPFGTAPLDGTTGVAMAGAGAAGFDVLTFAWRPNHFPRVGSRVGYELAVYPATPGIDAVGAPAPPAPPGRLRAAPPLTAAAFGTTAGLLAAPVARVQVPGGRTRYTWTVADARLEPGREYVWTVRAVDAAQVLRFRRGGVSAPARFRYAGGQLAGAPTDCYRPADLALVRQGASDRYTVSWSRPGGTSAARAYGPLGASAEGTRYTVSVTAVDAATGALVRPLVSAARARVQEAPGPQSSRRFAAEVRLGPLGGRLAPVAPRAPLPLKTPGKGRAKSFGARLHGFFFGAPTPRSLRSAMPPGAFGGGDLESGGPPAPFDGGAYRVEVCAVCVAGGATECASKTFGASGEPLDDEDDGGDDTDADADPPDGEEVAPPCDEIEAVTAVTAAPLTSAPGALQVDWQMPASARARSAPSTPIVVYAEPVAEPGARAAGGPAPDSVVVSARSSAARLTGLVPGAEYRVRVCRRCSRGHASDGTAGAGGPSSLGSPANAPGCSEAVAARTTGYACPDDTTAILALVAATGEAPDGLRVAWASSAGPAATDPRGWTVRLVGDATAVGSASPDPAAANRTAPFDGDTLLTGLPTGGRAAVEVCYRCPDAGADPDGDAAAADASEPLCVRLSAEVPACADVALGLGVEGDPRFDAADLTWSATLAAERYRLRVAPVDEGGLATAGGDGSVRGGASARTLYLGGEGEHTLVHYGDGRLGYALDSLASETAYEIEVCGVCERAGGVGLDSVGAAAGAPNYAICETLTLATPELSCRLARDLPLDYACGQAFALDEGPGGELTDRLAPGDTVLAGDWLVELTEVEPVGYGALGGAYASGGADSVGGGRRFRGSGKVEIPMLEGAPRLRVTFDAIAVNRACRLTDGEMRFGTPLADAMAAVSDRIAATRRLLGQADYALAFTSAVIDDGQEFVEGMARAADMDAAAEAVLRDAVAALERIPYMSEAVVAGVRDGAAAMSAAAAAGDEAAFAAARDRTAAATAVAQAYLTALFDAPYAVNFAVAGGTLADADGDGNPAVPADPARAGAAIGYERPGDPAVDEGTAWLEIAGEPYAGRYIAVDATAAGAGRGAGVTAGALGSATLAAGAEFVTVAGAAGDEGGGGSWSSAGAGAYATEGFGAGLAAGGSVTVAVALPSDTSAQERPAGLPDTIPLPERVLAGQVTAVAYGPLRRRVTVVPVGVRGGLAAPAIPLDAAALEARLDEIYGVALVDWDVTVEGAVEVAPGDFDGELDGGPTGAWSAFTDEDRAVVRAVRRELRRRDAWPGGGDADAFVVLVVPSLVGEREGFMPKLQSVGFLDGGQLGARPQPGRAFARTLAHELGHGAFGLEHPWERFGGFAEGSSDNLMDAGEGEALYKYQWDNIHDPERTVTIFDESAEGESRTSDAGVEYAEVLGRSQVYYSADAPGEQLVCLTPAGELYRLPAGAVGVFYHAVDGSGGGGGAGELAEGVLVGWFDGEAAAPSSGSGPLAPARFFTAWYTKDRVTGERGAFAGYAERFGEDVAPVPGQWYVPYPGPGATDAGGGEVGVAAYRVVVEGCEVAAYRAQAGGARWHEAGRFAAVASAGALAVEAGGGSEVVGGRQAYYGAGCVVEDEWCAGAFASHPWMRDDGPIGRAVRDNPCLLRGVYAVDWRDYPESAWMSDLKDVFAGLLAIGFAPAAIEVAIPVVAEAIIAYGAEELGRRAVSAATAAAIDASVQAGLHYYLPADGADSITWSEAVARVSVSQASLTAAQAMVEIGDERVNALVAAVTDCAYSGYVDDGGGWREGGFSASACGRAVAAQAVVFAAMKGLPALRRHARDMPRAAVVRGILRMLPAPAPGVQAASILPGLPSPRWLLYRAVRGSELDATDVRALFDLPEAPHFPEEVAAELAAALSEGSSRPLLRAALTDGDYWAMIRGLGSRQRRTLLEDVTAAGGEYAELLRGAGEAAGLRGHGLLVRCPAGTRQDVEVLGGMVEAAARRLPDLDALVAYADDPRITRRFVEHLFYGHGGSGGTHHVSSLLRHANRRLVKRELETAEGFYEATVDFSGVAKKKGFWPDDWSEERVLDEIKFVLSGDLAAAPGVDAVDGFTSTGQRIRLYISSTSGDLVSAYPVF